MKQLCLCLLVVLLATVCTAPADAQHGVLAPSYVFWGVMVADPGSRQTQWLPFALYPDARSARIAMHRLRRRGLRPQIVWGTGAQTELAQHALSAERGRRRLLSRLNEARRGPLDEDFGLSDNFDRTQRNSIEAGGFSPARQSTIMNAGFDPGRQAAIARRGFGVDRRQTIEQGGFSGRAAGVPYRPPSRGSFGTQPSVPNSRRGNFGTQGPTVTRNRGRGFGTQ